MHLSGRRIHMLFEGSKHIQAGLMFPQLALLILTLYLGICLSLANFLLLPSLINESLNPLCLFPWVLFMLHSVPHSGQCPKSCLVSVLENGNVGLFHCNRLAETSRICNKIILLCSSPAKILPGVVAIKSEMNGKGCWLYFQSQCNIV